MAYVNFDGLVDRFSQQIYQTRKGRLRMRLIDSLYQKYLPSESISGKKVLDAAGGLGQMTHWFLSKGNEVDYFDISQNMVESVRETFSEAIDAEALTAQEGSITDAYYSADYDVVNVHAVLEWLENPFDTLENITGWVKPGGYLGLMVYNKHMLMLRHMMRGTLSRAMDGSIGGDRRGLTPISPLDPAAVIERLKGSGFEILTQAGIRSFSDLAEKTVVDWYEEDDVFEAEYSLCEQRPYCDIGRYVLIIARRNE